MDTNNTAVFRIVTTIQDLCKEAKVDEDVRTGPAAKYPNSLINTILILKNLFGSNSERSFLRYLGQHHKDAFPMLPERSWFNRKAEKLVYIQRNMHQLLLQKSCADMIEIRIVDTTPVPVVKIYRANKCATFEKKTEVNFGYCASKDMYYYGQKLTLLVTPEGMPTEHALTPANFHDLKALKLTLPKVSHDLKRKKLVADKGYYDGDLEVTLRKQHKTTLIVPEKRKHQRKNTEYEKKLLKKRGIVETVNQQLQDQMNIDETRARSNLGLQSRIQSSILSFTFGIYFNILFNRPPLAIKSILT